MVATIGQIQICRFRKTPVRVTVRLKVLDAQVILGVRGLGLAFDQKSDLNQLIFDAPQTFAQ